MTQDELLSYCYENEIIWTIKEFENIISLVKNGTISSIQELSKYEMII
jgi:hypothetical protein